MQVGFSAVSITPPVGSALDGFIARLGPSTGVDLPLMARALWLEEDDARALIVSLDLLGLSPDTADALADALAAQVGLPPESVILACTHTHSGPMSLRMRGLGEADQAYLADLERNVERAAVEAELNKGNVRLAWGKAPVAIGVNRRQVTPDRGVVLGSNPGGPTDHLVRVAHFTRNEVSIILLQHAAHPYCLGGDTSLISPDFFGHAANRLEERGHSVVCLNGCAGDIAPLRAFGGPEAAQEEGVRLAEAVLVACENASREEHMAGLGVVSRELTIPYDKLPPLDSLERQLDEVDRTVRDEEREDAEVRRRLREAGQQWLKELRRALAAGKLPELRARVSVVQVGRGTLLALPGEVFYMIGQRIGEKLHANPVCAAGNCHGYIGYVPTPKAYAEGGYEVNEAHKYTGWWRVSRRTPALLRDCVMSLWRQLGGQLR